MSRLIILEGARGTGKSTIARNIRQKISEVTLINPTGFHADGKDGLLKIANYYNSWIDLITSMQNHDSTFVFDRFFFTERVFSELYKSYDFKLYYQVFLRYLSNVADVDIIFFTINDSDVLQERLVRDKVPFANVAENTIETFKQQDLYKDIMSDMQAKYSNPKLHIVDTTNKTQEEVEREVFRIIKREET